MFSRFTDRAHKVMQLANQEAQRSFHEYIGTEHILLGLVKEGSGIAAKILKSCNLNVGILRIEVERMVPPGAEMFQLGKLPQTPRAKRIVEYAIEESRNLKQNYVGTEHLILGLLREEEGVAAQVLINLGFKLSDLRDKVLAGLLPSENPLDSESINASRPQHRELWVLVWATLGALGGVILGSQQTSLSDLIVLTVLGTFLFGLLGIVLLKRQSRPSY
jgi:ATP-dependent Clp protease ATP-binding subunit ClpA